MNAYAQAYAFADAVASNRDSVATILAEISREEAGAISGAEFVHKSFDRANRFVTLAGFLANGALRTCPAPVAVRAAPDEHHLDADQAHALEVLERLQDGDRFVLEEERLGRALQHWITEGVAGKDEEGYFLTPAGRTFCERTLG